MTRIAPQTRARARTLRRDLTPQERRLWMQLRELNRRIGTRFRRQAPVGPFIADFCDFGARLVVEADGGGHGGPQDAARDAWFAAQGFRVLRFWNLDIDGNLEGVMQVVLEALETTVSSIPFPTRPTSGASRASPPPFGEGQGGSLPSPRHPSDQTGSHP